jgi:hypothetical protein
MSLDVLVVGHFTVTCISHALRSYALTAAAIAAAGAGPQASSDDMCCVPGTAGDSGGQL